MIQPKAFVQALHKANVGYFAGVPDSLLKSFCAYVGDNVAPENHVIAANEGAAVGLAMGYHLASGAVPLVYLQNSGLGNTVNPLLSLADPQVYSIPVLLLIGWRGEPGVADEPQHLKQGRIMLELLAALEIPYTVIAGSEADVDSVVARAVGSAVQTGGAHALVIRKGAFAEYESLSTPPVNYGWTREEAIACVVEAVADRDILVATTGLASRELYELRERASQGHERDFLTVGGMGHASQIALGLASQKPDRQVVCIDGDGAAIMHMGALAINGAAGLTNFHHIVLNNGVHDSVGAQPTAAFHTDMVEVAKASGYANCIRCDSQASTRNSLGVILDAPGPSFLEIRVDSGHRDDLGRPTSTPQENKQAFMTFVRSL